jgi:hypothetical protein
MQWQLLAFFSSREYSEHLCIAAGDVNVIAQDDPYDCK